jgi:hypothetical protein
MTYIPTALSRREDQLLQRYAKDRIVVEAGALLGHSTIQLARTAKHVTSIDRHTGYDYWANDTYRLFMRNLEVMGVSQKVQGVIGDCTLLERYPADFVFIDLCGTRAGTLSAIRAAKAPLIGVHDYDRSGCKGVAQAVEDSGYEVVERVDSLIILRKV